MTYGEKIYYNGMNRGRKRALGSVHNWDTVVVRGGKQPDCYSNLIVIRSVVKSG